MPYCARKHQLHNSLVYHVYNRSNAKVKVFHCDDDYLYSSAQYYCFGKIDELTTEDPCYVEFGNDATQRQVAYREFLRDFDEEQERRRGRPKKIIIS